MRAGSVSDRREIGFRVQLATGRLAAARLRKLGDRGIGSGDRGMKERRGTRCWMLDGDGRRGRLHAAKGLRLRLVVPLYSICVQASRGGFGPTCFFLTPRRRGPDASRQGREPEKCAPGKSRRRGDDAGRCAERFFWRRSRAAGGVAEPEAEESPRAALRLPWAVVARPCGPWSIHPSCDESRADGARRRACGARPPAEAGSPGGGRSVGARELSSQLGSEHPSLGETRLQSGLIQRWVARGCATHPTNSL